MSAGRDVSLASLVTRVTPVVMAGERSLPVLPALTPLFPDAGLVRGHCIACAGPVAMSVALGLAAQATQDGHWVAVLGGVGLGVRAATEMGVAIERLILVDGDVALDPGVLAAVVDGFDLIILTGASQVLPAVSRRFQARAQARGAVTLLVGSSGAFVSDVDVRADEVWWEGLGDGAGRLTCRRVVLRASGRRVPRARLCAAWLPGPDGGVVPAEPLRAPERELLDRVG